MSIKGLLARSESGRMDGVELAEFNTVQVAVAVALGPTRFLVPTGREMPRFCLIQTTSFETEGHVNLTETRRQHQHALHDNETPKSVAWVEGHWRLAMIILTKTFFFHLIPILLPLTQHHHHQHTTPNLPR
jgi:hypothetical protein